MWNLCDKEKFVDSKLRYRQFKRFFGRRSRFGVDALTVAILDKRQPFNLTKLSEWGELCHCSTA